MSNDGLKYFAYEYNIDMVLTWKENWLQLL